MTHLKRILTVFGAAILIVVGLAFTILSIPFILLYFSVISLFTNDTFDEDYNEFIKSIDGMYFFCYNNRRDSKEFIKTNILPSLTPSIKVIYVDGKSPKSDYDQKFVSRLLYNIKDRKGFPYLLKISNGEVKDKSIKHDFFKAMNQSNDLEGLNQQITAFYKSS